MTAIAMIGFGEAAQAFVSGWCREPEARRPTKLRTYDIKIEDGSQRERLIEAASNLGTDCCKTPQRAVAHADAVFSLVTADRALDAAGKAAAFLAPGTLYFDCNSCSPVTKQKAAMLVERAGGTYVDVAVMSPVHPGLHKTPVLISGPSATQAQPVLDHLGMNAKIAGNNVGRASSIKMLRSVIIKGIEALTAECLVAARRVGVDVDVISSLQASDPDVAWIRRATYNLERMMVHGNRRAAEMKEVALTLQELNLPNRMATATAAWQQDVGELEIRPEHDDFGHRADQLLKGLGKLTRISS